MNRRIAMGFVVAMVLIGSGFTISFYSYIRYGDDTKQVRHTYEVIQVLDNILSLVKDVETSSRGYTITNDVTYLEPYRTALRLLPAEINKLRNLTTDNRVQIRRRFLLEKLIKDKLAITKLRLSTKLQTRAAWH